MKSKKTVTVLLSEEEIDLIRNGWISPQGEVFKCEEMWHMDTAYSILVDKKIILPKDNVSYRDMIHKYRYIKFFNPHDRREEPEIYYVLSASVNLKDIEPTQKQTMAMGRLEKQLL